MGLRQIKVFLLVLISVVMFVTFHKNIDYIAAFHQRMAQEIRINVNDSSFKDLKYEINISRGVYVIDNINDVKVKNDVHNVKDVHTEVQQTVSSIRHPFTVRKDAFIIKNENLCRTENVTILVLVHTALANFERRKSIRQTWGNVHKFQPYNLRIAFIVGKSVNKTVQELIQRENALHRDIVQGNFLDTYHNLSNKAVLGLRWVTEYCPTARYILKADDDVFLNPFALFRELVTTYSNLTRTIMCNVRPNGTDIILRSGKWDVGKNEFLNMKYWPVTYCQGFFVAYTAEIIPELYEAAKSVDFVWLDDVYVTGFLAAKAGNITHSKLNRLSQHLTMVTSTEYMYKHWHRVLALERKLRILRKKKTNGTSREQ